MANVLLRQTRLVRHQQQPWRRTSFRSRSIDIEWRQRVRPFSSSTTRRSSSSDAATNKASSSVNAHEMSHFSALASTWWDPHGPSRLLHLMNPARHDFIRACHGTTQRGYDDDDDDDDDNEPSPHGLRYLDVGCGGGIFAESAARLASTAHVTAIDPGREVLAVARRHARADPVLQQKLEYRDATIETLPPADQYDVVALWEVIEHVDHPAEFLDRCGQFVKPGGWMVLSTIARSWVSWVTTKLVAEDILGAVPRGTHDWNKYINDDELRRHFEKEKSPGWGYPVVQGVVYVPGLGWKEVDGSEKVGNYFFGVRKDGA